jgi:hypothetical protein
VFLTGYEMKRSGKTQERMNQKAVAYRKIIKINYMGAVIEEFPIFECKYWLNSIDSSILELEDDLMVDLTIERVFIELE